MMNNEERYYDNLITMGIVLAILIGELVFLCVGTTNSKAEQSNTQKYEVSIEQAKEETDELFAEVLEYVTSDEYIEICEQYEKLDEEYDKQFLRELGFEI